MTRSRQRKPRWLRPSNYPSSSETCPRRTHALIEGTKRFKWRFAVRMAATGLTAHSDLEVKIILIGLPRIASLRIRRWSYTA
jgi:hypothetical protein